ncbi:MAG: 3-deoxy-D-manno-octulosonic acid transferase [Flavobacteriia bacterium]|nr:MAG: 3-deoxy-D-manno-octulosonic acid transferase [Flavobacteriia bacterium]
MGLLYTFFIAIYQLFLKLVALWHPKAKALVLGRRATWGILQNLPKTGHKRYWFHCASLGEYDMALPLIEACVAADPSVEIVVSFYSPSGMQHYHKRGFEPHAVFYLPADLPGQMRRLVKAVGAARLYVPKYEFWPNLLKEAHKAQVAIYSVSTMLRSSQVYFKWYGGFFRKALQRVAYFGVQNENTKQLLLKIGVKAERIALLGDLRFNRVLEAKARAKPNALIEQFVCASPLLILGSSWPAEEALLLEFLQKKPNALEQFKILIAPHDLSKGHLNQLKTQFPTALFYSELENSNLAQHQILILDTIGHLSAAYQYGSVAFVGGGFSGSLHNILEPLAYGLPVLFGPKHEKFPEAQQFIDLGFAQVVETAEGLDQMLLSLIENQKDTQAIIESKVFKLQGKIPDIIVK